MRLLSKKLRIDVDYFWDRGYTIVRDVYTKDEIDRFRRNALASTGPKGDLLSNPGLRNVLVDGRLVEIAGEVLGSSDILYAGDSSVTIGTQQHGYHKDNADRTDPNAPDWLGRYTILRFGVYLQDHRWHTGGLNLRPGSQNTTSLSEGDNVYVRTGVGDVAVWSLRISHSGNASLLAFPWWVAPGPEMDGKYPKWWRKAPGHRGERMALFAALGLDDAHHARYVDYLKTRNYIVKMWRNSHYDDESLAMATAAGLTVRNLPKEIEGDETVGANVLWQPIAY
jgi:hypothetical protein